MQQTDFNALNHVQFLVGSDDIVREMSSIPALPPFEETVLSFLNDLSKELIGKRDFSDIATFGFWIRKANLLKMRERFFPAENRFFPAEDRSYCSYCSYRSYSSYERHEFYLGRGLVFHIAPSNVPVNFAYSFVSALLMGNTNIVRVPSKDFEQVRIITNAINTVIKAHPAMKKRLVCVRYDHQNQQTAKQVNDLFSSICDCRVIWGGDRTIEALRQSPLQARSTEITFADRYSLAVIDAEAYLAIEDKDRVAQDFYNDTYFSDQNACTSPRVVIWMAGSAGIAAGIAAETAAGIAGTNTSTTTAEISETVETVETARSRIKEAQSLFWQHLHKLVKSKYNFQAVQAVDKLTRAYIEAARATIATEPVSPVSSVSSVSLSTVSTSALADAPADTLTVGIKIEKTEDNLITGVTVANKDILTAIKNSTGFNNNSGYFYEYVCKNSDSHNSLMELRALFNDKRCQTVGYIGDKDMFTGLLESGVKGIDRIVPIGATMDFDLLWDGYDLTRELTRVVTTRL